jgi:hypothetical protein
MKFINIIKSYINDFNECDNDYNIYYIIKDFVIYYKYYN